MIIRRALKRHSVTELLSWSIKRIVGLSTSRFRILPDFIVIGGQRCGTTSFFNYLAQHPDIYPSFPKETHYYSNHYHRGLNWYRSHFPQKIRGEGKRKMISGEATPYYLAHPHSPERIHKDLPHVRLIGLVRNPVDRAYSHYQHEVRSGAETLPFEEAIGQEAIRLENDIASLEMNPMFRSFNHQHFSYKKRGIYIEQFSNWEKYFSSDQILIIKSEDLFANPAEEMNRAFEFLGAPRSQFKQFKSLNKQNYQTMDNRTRKMLEEFYKPYNLQFYNYLGRGLGW